MVGKNFSANNATGNRRKSDFYETPYSLTEQLLEVEVFDKEKLILEPACGNDAIVMVLEDEGFNVKSYDIEVNFLTETNKYPYIVTNPPFSLAQEFILHAKKIAEQKFAFLLPLSYLHGKSRYDTIYLDTKYPLARVHVFTRYPLLGDKLREDGKYNTGMMVYAWFVWDKEHVGSPEIHWLDNDCYILRKKDLVTQDL